MKNDKKLDKQLEAEFAEDVLDLRAKLSKIVNGDGVESSSLGSGSEPSHMVTSSNAKPNPKKSTFRLLLPILAVAASITLAIIFIPGIVQPGEDDLYSSYYDTYPMALNQRGDAEEALNAAIADYLAEDYGKAAAGFQKLWNESGDAVYLLYQGTSMQATGSYREAIRLYNNVFRANDEKVIEQAQWYKALALIKLEQNDEALVLLESFSKDHYKYEEAQKLVEKIK